MFIRELFEKNMIYCYLRVFIEMILFLILLNNNDFYEINDGWLYVKYIFLKIKKMFFGIYFEIE